MTMKKHTAIQKEPDGTIFIHNEEAPLTLSRRILRWLGSLLGWVLICIPTFLITMQGLSGIIHQRLVMGKKASVSHGDEAVGWGWVLIALAIWFFGECCYLKIGSTFLRYLGWVFTALVTVIGFWFLWRSLSSGEF